MVDAVKSVKCRIELFGMKLPTPVFMAPLRYRICGANGHGESCGCACCRNDWGTDGGIGRSPSTNEAIVTSLAMCRASSSSTLQRSRHRGKPGPSSRVRWIKGIVVTLDTWIPGWRPRDLARSNFPQLRGHWSRQLFYRSHIRFGGEATRRRSAALFSCGPTFSERP